MKENNFVIYNRGFFDAVLQRVQEAAGEDHVVPQQGDAPRNVFFLAGAGGTGKTFLYRCLCNELFRLGKMFVCTAWTGIAAQLLRDGKTCTRGFGIPLQSLDHNSMSWIKLQTKSAEELRTASVIFWDEVAMAPQESLRVAHDLLCGIMQKPGQDPVQQPFAGKIIVFSGDFRQILPVMPGTNEAMVIIFVDVIILSILVLQNKIVVHSTAM